VPDGATRGAQKALARAKPAREAPGESRDQTPEAKIRCRFDEKR
jgi:hypothetical protein